MARKAGADGRVTAEAILRESLSLFAQYGFAAVSMRQIADKVGVQPGAIYQHHRSKQDLLVAVLDAHMDGLLPASEANQSGEGTSVQALERFARFHIQYHITRPDEVFVSYMELRSLEPAGYALIEGKRRQYEQVLKAILARGVADGTFQIADPHVSAMAILSMLTGVNTWYRSGGRLSQQKIEDIYTAMVLGAVGHQPTMGERNV